MIWLFILGIIVLATCHQGFRKILLWTLGIGSVALIGLFMIGAIIGR